MWTPEQEEQAAIQGDIDYKALQESDAYLKSKIRRIQLENDAIFSTLAGIPILLESLKPDPGDSESLINQTIDVCIQAVQAVINNEKER